MAAEYYVDISKEFMKLYSEDFTWPTGVEVGESYPELCLPGLVRHKLFDLYAPEELDGCLVDLSFRQYATGEVEITDRTVLEH